MTTLADRNPNVLRLRLPEEATNDPVQQLKFIEPYLSWTLLELDTGSADILIGNMDAEPGKSTSRKFVIRSGQVVSVWLRHHDEARRQDANRPGEPGG